MHCNESTIWDAIGRVAASKRRAGALNNEDGVLKRSSKMGKGVTEGSEEEWRNEGLREILREDRDDLVNRHLCGGNLTPGVCLL